MAAMRQWPARARNHRPQNKWKKTRLFKHGLSVTPITFVAASASAENLDETSSDSDDEPLLSPTSSSPCSLQAQALLSADVCHGAESVQGELRTDPVPSLSESFEIPIKHQRPETEVSCTEAASQSSGQQCVTGWNGALTTEQQSSQHSLTPGECETVGAVLESYFSSTQTSNASNSQHSESTSLCEITQRDTSDTVDLKQEEKFPDKSCLALEKDGKLNNSTSECSDDTTIPANYPLDALSRKIDIALRVLSRNIGIVWEKKRDTLTIISAMHIALQRSDLKSLFKAARVSDSGTFRGTLTVSVFDLESKDKNKMSDKNHVAEIQLAEAKGPTPTNAKHMTFEAATRNLWGEQFEVRFVEGEWKLEMRDISTFSGEKSLMSCSASVPAVVPKLALPQNKTACMESAIDKESAVEEADLHKKAERCSALVECVAESSKNDSSPEILVCLSASSQESMEVVKDGRHAERDSSMKCEVTKDAESHVELENHATAESATGRDLQTNTEIVGARSALKLATSSSDLDLNPQLPPESNVRPLCVKQPLPRDQVDVSHSPSGNKQPSATTPAQGDRDCPASNHLKLSWDMGIAQMRENAEMSFVLQIHCQELKTAFQRLADILHRVLAGRSRRHSNTALISACRTKAMNFVFSMTRQRKRKSMSPKWAGELRVADVVVATCLGRKNVVRDRCVEKAVDQIRKREFQFVCADSGTLVLVQSGTFQETLRNGHLSARESTALCRAMVIVRLNLTPGGTLEHQTAQSAIGQRWLSLRAASANTSGYVSFLSSDVINSDEETGFPPRDSRLESQMSSSLAEQKRQFPRNSPMPHGKLFHLLMKEGDAAVQLLYLWKSTWLNGVKMTFQYKNWKGSLRLGQELLVETQARSKEEAEEPLVRMAVSRLQEYCWTVQLSPERPTEPRILTISKQDVMEQTEEDRQAIPEDNKGNMLLRKLGWRGGGIGKTGTGIEVPVSVGQEAFRRQCLGTASAQGMAPDFSAKFSHVMRRFAADLDHDWLVVQWSFSNQEEIVLQELCKRHLLLFDHTADQNVVFKQRTIKSPGYVSLRSLSYKIVDNWIKTGSPPDEYILIPPKSDQMKQSISGGIDGSSDASSSGEVQKVQACTTQTQPLNTGTHASEDSSHISSKLQISPTVEEERGGPMSQHQGAGRMDEGSVVSDARVPHDGSTACGTSPQDGRSGWKNSPIIIDAGSLLNPRHPLTEFEMKIAKVLKAYLFSQDKDASVSDEFTVEERKLPVEQAENLGLTTHSRESGTVSCLVIRRSRVEEGKQQVSIKEFEKHQQQERC